MDLQRLMQQAHKMQNELSKVEKQLEASEYEGVAGGDGVKVVINGKNLVTSVSIDSDLLSVENKEILEDLIMVAINNASEKANKDREDKTKSITGGISLPGLF